MVIGVDAVPVSDDVVIQGEQMNVKERNNVNRTMLCMEDLIYYYNLNVLHQVIFLLVFERFSLAKYIIIHINKA